jgi:hypothetical protein
VGGGDYGYGVGWDGGCKGGNANTDGINVGMDPEDQFKVSSLCVQWWWRFVCMCVCVGGGGGNTVLRGQGRGSAESDGFNGQQAPHCTMPACVVADLTPPVPLRPILAAMLCPACVDVGR